MFNDNYHFDKDPLFTDDVLNEIGLEDNNVFQYNSTTKLWEARSNLTMDGYINMQDNPINDVGYIDFNLINGIAPAEGRAIYNDIEGCLNFGMKGSRVNLQVGLEQLIQGRNESGATFLNGRAARIAGTHSSGRPVFGYSDADESAAAGAVGLFTEDIEDTKFGYVTTFGLVRDFDTTAWNAYDRLYVSNTPGGLTTIIPTGSERKIFIGVVLKDSAEEGIVWVNPVNTSYLRELSGNTFTTEVANNVIQFNGTIWENRADLTINGTTILGDAGVADYVQFSVGGGLSLHGTARVEKELQVTAENFRLGASAPTAAIIGNYAVLQFTGVATTQAVNTTFHLPDDMDFSEDLTIHIHWAPSNDNAGNVKWQIAWLATSSENGELISGAGDTISVIDATHTTQDELLESGSMVISTVLLAAEDTIGVTLFRDPTDGDDTYGSAASLVLIEFKYTSNKLGEPL